MPRCAGFKPDGAQCERIVDGRSTYCYSHDPTRKEQRRRAASKAGSAKPGSEIAEVKAQLRKLADDCLAGKIKPGVAAVTHQILGTWLKALDSEARQREVTVREREFIEIRKPEFEQLQGEVAELRELMERQRTQDRRSGPWAG